jgi:hypothetical protein
MPTATDWNDSYRAGFAPPEDAHLCTAHTNLTTRGTPTFNTDGEDVTDVISGSTYTLTGAYYVASATGTFDAALTGITPSAWGGAVVVYSWPAEPRHMTRADPKALHFHTTFTAAEPVTVIPFRVTLALTVTIPVVDAGARYNPLVLLIEPWPVTDQTAVAFAITLWN